MSEENPTTGDRNEALWLRGRSGPLEVGPAPRPVAGPGELVVRVRAVAVNPIDALSGSLRRIVTPWLRYPTVLGTDVAGEVESVGPDVVAVAPGDRVLGFAAGQERARNTAAEGAFQDRVLLLERMTTPIPDDLTFEQAAVLPLALATASAGLYETDQLGLPFPTGADPHPGEVVLVWGASTSVGCNAVQLARAGGYTVIATAGRPNHDLVRSLGAETVVDYRDDDVDRRILAALGGRRLVGTVAIGRGALGHALRITRRTPGSRRIASAYPDPLTRARSVLARLGGVTVTGIWGGTPVVSPVGPAIFRDFLPAALADGRYRAAPDAQVNGEGLAAIPAALEVLKNGVSGAKVVVRTSR